MSCLLLEQRKTVVEQQPADLSGVARKGFLDALPGCGISAAHAGGNAMGEGELAEYQPRGGSAFGEVTRQGAPGDDHVGFATRECLPELLWGGGIVRPAITGNVGAEPAARQSFGEGGIRPAP